MIHLTKFLQKEQLSKITALLLLILLLVIAAVPGYITGKWQWKQPPAIAHLSKLKNIRKVGLTLPEWKSIKQSEQIIGARKWSVQFIEKTDSKKPAILLALPQNGPQDQPQVEWSDIDTWGKINWGKWDISQESNLKFTVPSPNPGNTNSQIQVEARYFRAATQPETFAVVQWYSLPDGGHTSPIRWFVADQLAQWQKQRVSWVAVVILLPIEPLGNIEDSRLIAQSLAEKVQTAILKLPSQ